MARLSVRIRGEERVFPVPANTADGLTIGRGPANHINLDDPALGSENFFTSRAHARVELRGTEAWIVDLNSRNGTRLNRLYIKREAALSDGATLQIGRYELLFEERVGGEVVLSDNRYRVVDIRSARQIGTGELRDLALDAREFFRINKRWNAIVEARDLLPIVMAEVLQLVRAQRGVLMLFDAQGTTALDNLAAHYVYPPSGGQIVVSTTIATKVVSEREAVLVGNALVEYSGAQSIVGQAICSMVCAPLIVDNRMLGLIYLDSSGLNVFSERERELLAELAGQAAIVIERVRLTETLRKQEKARSLLERFISPNVASDLASYFAQHGKLREPEELVATVLFADVKGFSNISERLAPRDIQELLNDYLHEMTDVIFAHDGTLDKYIGDGIMAIFGAPHVAGRPDDHAVRAVQAALGMVAAHRRLVEKSEPSKAFDFRIGINTGPVLAGFFGTLRRLEYTVIGATVNTASRLEGKAEPNSVLISDATRAAIDGHFELVEVGEAELKGMTSPVKTFRVVRENPA